MPICLTRPEKGFPILEKCLESVNECLAATDLDYADVVETEATLSQAIVEVFGHDSFQWREIHPELAQLEDIAESSPGDIFEKIADPRAYLSTLSRCSALVKKFVAELYMMTRRVFLVHGHDEGMRETVARFLEKMDFLPIILHEQPNMGRTIIEKVESYGNVKFAVVLLSPDDMGGSRSTEPKPRARQNVIMELGYFIGKLGRSNVCALKRDEVELPSDFAGVVYEPFDASGGWRLALARELQASGFEVDWNKIMRP